MAYQSFPWQQGDSRSFEKLAGLYLPLLRGKSVLDVGCNTGYFCGWAAFQNASRVRGIDINPAFVSQAAALFPECSFACMSWEDLGPERFDAIFCISVIHYANDQQAMIDALMARLAPDGVLILEISHAPGEEDVFVEVERSIDTRLFPTRAKVRSMLSPYTFKLIAQSAQQAGDPIPRYVYHVYHKRPYAVTMLDGHYTGKTTTAEALLRPEIRRIPGDALYAEIANGKRAVSAALGEAVAFVPGTRRMDSAGVTFALCEKGLLPALLDVVLEIAGGEDFLLDHFIPSPHRNAAREHLNANGYYVVDLSLHEAENPPWTRQRPPFEQYGKYTRYLEKRYAVDEGEYLAANPDVAQAVAEGKIPSGRYHYLYFGRKENRKLRPE